MDVELKSYAKGEKKPSIMTGKIRKSGDEYYSKLGKDEFIGSEQYALIINHKLKTINYQEGGIFQQKQTVDAYVEQLNTWLLNAKSTKLLKKEGTKKTYQITLTDGMIKSIQITLDMEKKIITKIIYSYVNNQFVATSKVIINYKNISFKKPESAYFSGTKYLNIGKKVTLKPNYKHYTLYIQ